MRGLEDTHHHKFWQRPERQVPLHSGGHGLGAASAPGGSLNGFTAMRS